jgi:hypothetical protein
VTDGVAGTQNDITFDSVNTPINKLLVCVNDPTVSCTTDQECVTATGVADDKCGVPDCTANATIKKEATAFGLLPSGCSGTACTGVRALVFGIKASTANKLIPDGSVLYTCNFAISGTAADATYPLTISNVVMSFPSPPGGQIAGATGVSGSVIVGVVPPTNTPGVQPTNTPVVAPTNTPGGLPTATKTPAVQPSATAAATNTAVATATNTPVPAKLAAAIGATDTTLTVNDASSFSSSGGTIQIGSEQITYTGKSGNTLTGLTRGANGTTAATHAVGDVVTVVTPPAPSGGLDEDGCQISTVGGSASWLLLIPAVGLFVVRRRHR